MFVYLCMYICICRYFFMCVNVSLKICFFHFAISRMNVINMCKLKVLISAMILLMPFSNYALK